MRKLLSKLNDQSGVALILTLGILTLLLVLGVGFVMNMALESGGAVQHDYRVKARLVAEAGIERAIMELRAKAKQKSYDGPRVPYGSWETEQWFYDQFGEHTGLFGAPARPSFASLDGVAGNNFTEEVGKEELKDGSGNTKVTHVGKSVVKIRDCASMINLNDWNPNLEEILTRLFTKLGVSSPAAVAQNILNKRAELGDKFPTKESIKLAAGVGDTIYDAIKDYVTVFGYIDQNTVDSAGAAEPRAPVNINTAPKVVLQAVLEGVEGVAEGYSGAIADMLITNRSITYWPGFDWWIDNDGSLSDISKEIKQRVKDNANPNRIKPAQCSTEFCFSSGGYYEIESTGKVYKRIGNVDIKVAEKTVTAVVRIYKTWNQTKKAHFEGTEGAQLPKAYKVTTLDSCPVRWYWYDLSASAGKVDDRKLDPCSDTAGYNQNSQYLCIPDAVKLGFWDNFGNDVFYDKSGTQVRTSTPMFWCETYGWTSSRGGGGTSGTWYARADDFGVANGRLTQTQKAGGGLPYAPITELVGRNKTRATPDGNFDWSEFNLKMYVEDKQGPRDVPDPIPESDEIPHHRGTFEQPSPANNWTGFAQGVNCTENFWEDGDVDAHNGTAGMEWPVHSYYVGWVLFNSTATEDDKIYICQIMPGEGAVKGGQFQSKFGEANASALPTSDIYFLKKDYCIQACGDGYWFTAIPNGIGNTWQWMDWHARSAAEHGVIGIYGCGNYNVSQPPISFLPTEKIGYVRIIPGSPGTAYTYKEDPNTFEGNPTIDKFAYFESAEFDAGQTVEWGTVTATITAQYNHALTVALGHETYPPIFTEKIVFNVKTENTSWPAPQNFLRAGVQGAPGDPIALDPSQKIQYRALFVTEDDRVHHETPGDARNKTEFPYYSQTVALEDVTITYLPKAEILYSREVQK
jgi:hypothetical protein